ncbi:hypothetical protein BA190_24620 [Labrys sp. WJW]|nr:hypothetical protein BA190_24620 [Labrys sp. WJW]
MPAELHGYSPSDAGSSPVGSTIGRLVGYGSEFDEVKNGEMGGASAAKTFVLASEATLQMAIFHLTALRRDAFGR